MVCFPFINFPVASPHLYLARKQNLIKSSKLGSLGAANISIFSPTTSFGRFGGEGFRSRCFQIETLYRKKEKNHNL